MTLLDFVKEKFRKELPVKSEILEREKKFNREDPAREFWILNNTYLCEGDLAALEQHPPLLENYADRRNITFSANYEPLSTGPAKRVVVRVPLGSNEQVSKGLVEKVLKLDLNSRGCNAGVFYKQYTKGEFLYAQAVPASISRNL